MPNINQWEVYGQRGDNVKQKLEFELNQVDKLWERIDSLLKYKDIVKIAIDGNSGAGKSTLAKQISQRYDCNVFHMDHFFLTPELRTEQRLKEIGGNVDYIRFYNEVITGLDSGSCFQYHVYNCSKRTMDKTITVVPKKLNVIEGSYSMHPMLINSYDLKIFLHIGEKEQSRRILERNGATQHQKFLRDWIPMENRYFDQMQIPEKCDLILQG